MANIKDIIDGIMKRVPEVVGVILIDIDGIPIEVAGQFDMKPEDLGALLSACYNSYAQVGTELMQKLDSIIVEYGDLKLCQNRMPRGLLTIIAGKNAHIGMIRLEAKRAIDILTKLMQDTMEMRQEMVKEMKFRLPDSRGIADILARFDKEGS